MIYNLQIEADSLNEDLLREVLTNTPEIFQKKKQFLFISEEGEDVCEGDTWYEVSRDPHSSDGPIEKTCEVGCGLTKINDNLKFTSLETANTVFLMRFNTFSIGDILNAIDKEGNVDVESLIFSKL